MADSDLHDVVGARLKDLGQRYTAQRRVLVGTLVECEHPVTVHQLLERAPAIAQSSAYRNLAVLEEAGAVHRIVTTDDFARFELDQELTEHHHHLICSVCGSVTDFVLPDSFESEIEQRLARAARQQGFTSSDHRLDVLGTCQQCHDERNN